MTVKDATICATAADIPTSIRCLSAGTSGSIFPFRVATDVSEAYLDGDVLVASYAHDV